MNNLNSTLTEHLLKHKSEKDIESELILIFDSINNFIKNSKHEICSQRLYSKCLDLAFLIDPPLGSEKNPRLAQTCDEALKDSEYLKKGGVYCIWDEKKYIKTNYNECTNKSSIMPERL